MFETSVVTVQGRRSKGRIGLFTASILAHSAIVLGAVGVSIASVDFPRVAPHEYRVAPQFSVPPPLGNPNGGRAPAPPRPAATPVPPRPDVITAPPSVPETITTHSEPPATNPGDGESSGDATGSGTEPGPVGVPWGQPDGVGDLNAPPGPIEVPQVEEKIYQAHEVKAPVLVHRVEPRYPAIASRAGMTATVVVRCIIDRNGRVRDPETLVSAPIAAFNASVLDAVSRWTFKPGTVGGQPVDSYFTLTVQFTFKR